MKQVWIASWRLKPVDMRHFKENYFLDDGDLTAAAKILMLLPQLAQKGQKK